MNIGVLREKDPHDRRVALTPPVVRQLVERGNVVWVEQGAAEGPIQQQDAQTVSGAQHQPKRA